MPTALITAIISVRVRVKVIPQTLTCHDVSRHILSYRVHITQISTLFVITRQDTRTRQDKLSPLSRGDAQTTHNCDAREQQKTELYAMAQQLLSSQFAKIVADGELDDIYAANARGTERLLG